MTSDVMLTTIDNPYDPFDEWEQWLAFDVEQGYNTCGYLARIANTSSGLSEEMNNEEIERAMDEICKLNFLTYKKVERKTSGK